VKPTAPRKPPREKVPNAARSRTARADFSAAERRRKREERAEVKRFTRRARRRRLGWLGGFGVLVLLGLMVGGAVFSPILALRHVVVDGTQRLDAAALAAAVDGQLGTPLALLDEDRIRTELAEFTLIRSYVTELVPPDTMLIHIVERSPIGVISSPDGFRLTDPAGVTIETTVARPEGYPQIELASGEDVEGAGFRSMAEVLLALPPAVLAQVDTIAARTRDDVTLTLTGSAQRVVWGSADDSQSKAAVLAGLLALHAGDGPGEYDVSAPGIGVFHKD
jgi:cell division protein FtsQ